MDKKQTVGLRACRVAALGAWSLAALAGHGATDGTWASATDGGSWADPANWVGGVLPDGGVATFNWTGQTNRIEVTGAGEIPLTALNIRGAILPRANSESVFSGMTFVFSDPATMTVARANFAFHANTLACAGRLVLSGTDGRVALHDPQRLTGGLTLAAGGWARVQRDGVFGAAPEALVPDAITLDGGILQNALGETVLAPTRGVTVTARGGALAAGYLAPSRLVVNGPVTGPGGLDIAYETRPVVLSNPANDWAGDTRVGTFQCTDYAGSGFALVLGADEVLPHGPGKGRLLLAPYVTGTNSALDFLYARLDLDGHAETVNAVSATCGGIVKSTTPGGVLRTCADEDMDFRGTLDAGATLEHAGAGTFVCASGSSSVQGTLAACSGTVEVAAACFAASGRLALAGGAARVVPLRGVFAEVAASGARAVARRSLYPDHYAGDSRLLPANGGTALYRARWHVPEAGTYSFAKSYRGAASLTLDGVEVLSASAAEGMAVRRDVALAAGWHDLELRFGRTDESNLGRGAFMSGIVYDPLNGAFATDEERGRARVFTDDGGPGLLAAGVPSTFAGVLDLRTDGALHVAAAAEPFVFAGRLTTDAAAPSTLAFETDSGAPFVFGGPHAHASAILDAPVACAAGLVATNYVWLKTPLAETVRVAAGATLTRDWADALAADVTLDATDLRVATEGLGAGTIVVPEGRRVIFSTQREAGGVFIDGPEETRVYANNVVLQGGTLEFDGAGTTTFNGAVSGHGTVRQSGTGVVLFRDGAQLSEAATLEVANGVFRADGALGAACIHLHGGRFALEAEATRTLANPLTAEGGGIELGAGADLELTGTWTGVNPVSLWGAGTLRIAGEEENDMAIHVRGGTLVLAKPRAAGTVIGCETGACVRLEADGAIWDGGRVELGGGTLDMNGHALSVQRLACVAPGCVVVNNAPGDATLTLLSPDDTDVAGTLADGVGRLFLAYAGTATCDLSGATLQNSGVQAQCGTVRFAASEQVTASLVRFTPTASRPAPQGVPAFGNSGVQIAEFRLTRGGSPVAWPEGTAASGNAVSAKEGPACAVDGQMATKWYVAAYRSPLLVACPEPVTFDGYQFATANDAPGRDPVSWTVDVGQVAGAVTNWVTLDAKVDVSNDVPTARHAYIPVQSVLRTLRRAALPVGYRLDVAAGATARFGWCEDVFTALSGEGTLVAEDGARLTLADGCTFSGHVAGDEPVRLAFSTAALPGVAPVQAGASLVNDGVPGALVFADGRVRMSFGAFADGTAPLGLEVAQGTGLLLAGAGSTHTGPTQVGAGAWVQAGAGRVASFFRFTPIKGSGGQTKSDMQLSELQLVCADARLPWPEGTTATTEGDSSFKNEGAAQLLDGLTGTKCYWGVATAPVVIKLPSPIYFEGYQWYTANDSMDRRNPVSWTFEYSLDGVCWTLFDAQSDRETVAQTQTLAWRFPLFDAPCTPSDALSDASDLQLAAAATCRVVHVEETVGALAGAGVLRIERGGLVRLAVRTDARFGGEVSGAGTLAKAGAAWQALGGRVALEGALVVEEGTLALDDAVLAGVTNIVLRGGVLAGRASAAGDCTVSFEGGAWAASLAVAGRLALVGEPLLATGFEGRPVRGAAFTFAETDDASRARFERARCMDEVPAGWTFGRRASASAFTWTLVPGGTVLLLR